MPRSISAGLATHLAGTTTTMAMCWKLTRPFDGRVWRLTNHDKDIVVTGSGVLNGTYVAIAAFTSKTFTFTANLAPSRVSMDSVLKDVTDATLTADDIAVGDLRCGLFDNSEVEVFMVNFEDISQGTLDLVKGNWGDVKIIDSKFDVEVRSLAERLRKKFVDVYTPDCRVDLFSTKCGLTAATFREPSHVDTVVSQLVIDLPAGASALTRQLDVLVDPSVETDTPSQKAAARRIAEEGMTDSGVIWTLGTDPDPLDLKLDGFPAVLKLVKLTATEDGTPRRPFLVNNTADFNAIRNNIYACYALTTDLDFVAFGTWTPIPIFYGSIDGRGRVISNLDSDLVASTLNNALVGELEQGGVIRRLGVEDSDFRGTNTAVERAAFAAVMRPGSLIADCYSFNCNFDGNEMGGIASNLVGGDGQRLRDPVIIRCWAANIMVTGTAGATSNGVVCAPSAGGGVGIQNTFGDNAYSQGNGGIEIASATSGLNVNDPGSRVFATAAMQTRATYSSGGSQEAPVATSGNMFDTLPLAPFLWGAPWRINSTVDYPRLIPQAV